MGRVFGNRPDCAYYLMLALCGAAVFTALGGIFTYMGYWPDLAFHQEATLSHSNHSATSSFPNHHIVKVNGTSVQVYSIVGPLCLLIGLIITMTIGVLAIKYDCEHEPEDAKVAIMRLASEVSLNLSTNGMDTSKYEMIRTAVQNSSNNHGQQQQAGPSSAGSDLNPRGPNVV